MDDMVQQALNGKEIVVDITTTGRQSGLPRRIEIWCHNIGGRIIITGSPGPRNWYADLAANRMFMLHVKGETNADLSARARLITDVTERRGVMESEEAAWYREFVGGDIDRLLKESPMLEVIFDD